MKAISLPLLALLPGLVVGFLAPPAPLRAPRQLRVIGVEACVEPLAPTQEQPPADAFTAKRDALLAGLRREYESFFQPLEEELYSPTVTFDDPLLSLSGIDAYRSNVDMLGGRGMLGVLFSDSALVMHDARVISRQLVETRWTLQFRFKLLPWQPLARFTGVSRYTLDADARVLRQQDYWDSLNLQPGGGYAPMPKLAALSDFVKQLTPKAPAAEQASGRELPYVLLRRAPGYEVRRYPQHVSVATDYLQRIDGFGTLGAYVNGANADGRELSACVPSLVSVRPDSRSAEQLKDDSYYGVAPDRPKVMRWPISVPAMGDGPPPQPAGAAGFEGACRLELMPSRVVAALGFSDPTTEPNVRGYAALLGQRLRDDGLVADETDEEEAFRLAQFDALNSFGARRSEVWVALADGHPWSG